MLKTISNRPNKSIIVMIDDEELCLTSMEMILLNTRYNLVTFKHTEPGISYIQENYANIQLIFLDLMMPGIGGLEALKSLKAFSSTASIPVIIQTASLNHSDLLECYKLGAIDHMIKPYSKAATIKKIEKILG